MSATGVAENIPQGFGSSNVVVMGNQIKHTGWHGIQSDVPGETTTDSITVMNNSITSVNKSGIYGYKISNWNITGNIVQYATDETAKGIFIDEGGSGTNISWNRITNCINEGIYVMIRDNVANLQIVHNLVKNSGHCDLYFVNFDSSTFGSNFLIAYNTLGSVNDSPCSDCNFHLVNNGEAMDLHEADVFSNSAAVSLTCSPKPDPDVMRVNGPETGKETLDETQETHARADCAQAA